MRVFLSSFRKHDKLSLSLDDLTLIKGGSGQGKTTVFSAIYWCLYGTLKCVHPSAEPQAHTKVVVEICGPGSPGCLTITRSRNPRYLTVETGGKTYKDKEAQGVIEDMFGEKSVWVATSYVEQGKDHPLLEKSNLLSMELLERLAFSQEKPREFLSKVEGRYKSLEGEAMALAKRIEQIHGGLSPRLPLFCGEKMRGEEELAKMREELKDGKERLPRLTEKVLEEKRLTGVRDTLEGELAKVDQMLSSLPPPIGAEGMAGKKKEERRALLRERDLARDYKSKHDLHKAIKERVDAYHQKELLSMDLYELSSAVEKFAHHSSLAVRLGLPYERNAVERAIEKTRERIEAAQKELALYEVNGRVRRQRENLLRELADLPVIGEGKDPEVIEKELEGLRRALEDSERRKKILACPHCGNLVSYHNSTLIPVEKDYKDESISLREQVENKQAELSSARKERETSWKRDALRRQLDKLSPVDGGVDTSSPSMATPETIKQWQSALACLHKIEFLPLPPYNRDELSLAREMKDLLAKSPLLPDVQRDPVVIEEELNEVESTIEELERRAALEKENLRLVKRREEILSSLSSLVITDSEDELEALGKIIGSLEEDISQAEFHNGIFRQYEEYNRLEEEYGRLYDSLLALQRLKKNALRAECSHLENVVGGCNYVLELVCGSIFEEPLVAKLQLTKQLKNGNNVHRVNFSLHYRGVEGEVEQLSGGERQRLSIALTLALSQFSSSFLLLDECLAYLDPDLQEACIQAIREFTPGKTVVYIGHNMTEGYFSRSLEL